MTVRCPVLVRAVKRYSLILCTYGDENNVLDFVDLQENFGVVSTDRKQDSNTTPSGCGHSRPCRLRVEAHEKVALLVQSGTHVGWFEKEEYVFLYKEINSSCG